jgi:CRISPR/Cas system-associated endoribonuclease Cas2
LLPYITKELGLATNQAQYIIQKIQEKPHLLEKLNEGTLDVGSCALVFKDWIKLIQDRIINDSMEALKLYTPTLNQLKFYANEGYAFGLIVTLLKDVLDNLCITGTMNDNQLGMAAKMIIADYGTLRISEIRYVFLNGIKGVYGKNYNRIDVSILMDWLRTYDVEERLRNIEALQLERAKREQSKTSTFFCDMPKETKEKLIRLSSSLEAEGDENIKNQVAAKIAAMASMKKVSVDYIIGLLQESYNKSDKSLSFNEFLKKSLNIN